MKLVSLSISGDIGGQTNFNGDLAFRDKALWFPDIPSPRLSFLGIDNLRLLKSDKGRPLFLAILGGPEGQHLHHVLEIRAYLGDGGNLWGLDVYFVDELEPVRLGVDDVTSEETLAFKVNAAGGERIATVDALYMNNGSFVGLKVKRVLLHPNVF